MQRNLTKNKKREAADLGLAAFYMDFESWKSVYAQKF